MNQASGPLSGFRLIEIAGIGPTQLTGMLLADMGADIIRVDRPAAVDLGIAMPEQFNLMNRSRPSVAIDLKNPQGVETVLTLCEKADALFEGFRPGVMERLGLGPDSCMQRNPALVYGRMTGWGQDGPLAETAGHDPNYIGIAGAFSLIGEAGGPPVYPLNLVGDFRGGGAYLAMGLLAALLETSKSGKGQVVDSAMVDGVASMLTYFYGLKAAGLWKQERGSNILDGGSHFAHPYKTRDDQYIVIAALEGRFYQELLDRLGIDDPELRDEQMKQKRWPEFQQKLEKVFASKTRDEWCELLEGTDTCFSPVLSLDEAAQHPHAKARNTYVDVEGITQPAPTPRFSRTPGRVQSPPPETGQDTITALKAWGLSEAEIKTLQEDKAIA